MAKAGRKPKPAALRIIEGNREHRPIKETPKIQSIYPEPPRWMRGIARAEWKRVVPHLAKVGLLTAIDVAMLEAYCVSYARWRELKGERGEAQAMRDLKAMATEFGMSPSARTRVEFIKGKESDDEDLD